MTKHDDMIRKLQEFRRTTTVLSLELDSHLGPGVRSNIADHFRLWSGALIGLLNATPLDPPADAGPGVTTYNA